MFNKILVAIDTSPTSKYVFDEGLSLAKSFQARLMLLHVLSAEEAGMPNWLPLLGAEYGLVASDAMIESYRRQWEAFEQQGLELLRSRTTAATNAGVNTEFTQHSGSPGRTICDSARTWGADLLVVGRRGRSGLSELLLGSVSNYVLHHAPCSVLVVQGITCPTVESLTAATSSN
ncbi:MAG: universal stress protein [Chroococcidiopsidaceae cyanobacterium CP_BM_RX_35]|nr:universal stress protein [Chroococcidiopsidaceae cyanobacterium CP_BM_RX_35]